MTTTVIAYFPSPPQGVWHLGPVPIRAYALFIIVGIVAALLIGDRRWEARGGERGVIYDIALWAVPFGLIGGRLYHLATDWRTYFGEGGAGPAAALRIWDGGLGIWGAVALGGVGAWIACRRRGIPLPAFGDAIAPGIVLAQAIGRLGNYFNQELFGRETTMPWGLEIFYRRDPAGFVDVHSLDGVSTGQLAMVVQPTFLYELLWNLLVFAVLIYLDRRFTIGHGRLFAIYVAGYCVGRFCIELLRDDSATHIAGIRINSFTSTFVFVGAVVYLILAPKGREDPATLSGSAAELLEPDSIEEVETVSAPSAAAVAAAGDEPVGSAKTTETTAAVDAAGEDVQKAETTAVDEPEAEAVAAEAEAAEVDAPVVEVAETPEQTSPEEPEPAAAVAEQPDDDAAEPGEPAGDVEPEEVESANAAGEDGQKAETIAVDEPEAEAVAAEAEAAVVDAPVVEVAETPEQTSPEEPEPAAAVGEQPADDAAEPGEPAGDVEPEEVESANAAGEAADEASEPADDKGAAAEEPADDKGAAAEEPADDKGAAAEPADDEGAAAEPADGEGAAAEEPVSNPTPEPTGSTPTWWGSRLRRLNPRLRR